jgi:TolA-binding protein
MFARSTFAAFAAPPFLAPLFLAPLFLGATVVGTIFPAPMALSQEAGKIHAGQLPAGQIPAGQVPAGQVPANQIPGTAAYLGPRLDADSRAEKEMEVARYYASHGNFTGAATRFRVVVTRFPASPAAGEALYRLVDVFLKLGVRSEAQTAAAVLDRKFPRSQWRADALDTLRAAGLRPAEDQTSWISLAFR